VVNNGETNIMEGIDWKLLRSQKLTLVQLIESSPPTVAEDLTGILHLIDFLQDEAATFFGDEIVFGEESMG
jgi:hypothetical protein